MPYLHDVFISYKRETNWTIWTRDHFKSLLESYLQQDLGAKPAIFVDERMEHNIGESWVSGLGTNLARSKVAVILFSLDYFSSDWCVHELDLMLARAARIGGATALQRLIIPVVVHDGEMIPDAIKRLTAADLKRFRIAHINRNTQDYHDFSVIVRDLSPAIADAVRAAPAFEDAWIAECCNRFDEVYDAAGQGRRLSPTSFTMKPMPGLTSPPRLVVT